ncbi:M28 family peptidase [Brevibacillus massiliensis]|jgi:hypothetical protein|uniref:M28 family peptidase n=1 Tax=Brevibacillus massiliensis TaxID=1118054 RepID=UPI00030335E3|nr:M28 family peptidase [Brevibacillus massiliensis]
MGNRNVNLIEASVIEEVNKENLMEFTREISKEVRLSGSAEERRAFEYVQQKIESFGIPARIIWSDQYISLPVHASLTVGGTSLNCITHSMAVSTGEQGVEGELVYVGTADPKNFKKCDLTGKIAVIQNLAVPGAVKAAQEAGAKGIVFIHATYTHEMIVSPVWGSPTPETVGQLPQIPVVSVNYEDGEWIKSAIQKSPVSAWMKTKVDTGWRPIPTLIAEIKGSIEPDKFVLFSGHIDSWHYGAMDNGSANATMIETARILSKHKDRLRRTLRLAFWSGHSHGRYAGSAWYCDTNWEDLRENCVLHINIDSVGAKGATVLSEANSMAETRELGAAAIERMTGNTFTGSRFGRAGDQSFWGTGTPSLFMGLSEQEASTDPASQAFAQLFGNGKAGGFGWWWHTTEDTIDKIDPNFLERDCKIYVNTVFQACSQPIIPINQLAAIDEVTGYLLDYREKSGNHLDFSASLDRIGRVKKLTSELYERIQNEQLSEKQISIVNQGLMELSHVLVPLNYVSGDIYEHDPALKQAPIPALANSERLAAVEVGSDEFYQLKTLYTRRLNRVNHLLLQAVRTMEATLHKLSN